MNNNKNLIADFLFGVINFIIDMFLSLDYIIGVIFIICGIYDFARAWFVALIWLELGCVSIYKGRFKKNEKKMNPVDYTFKSRKIQLVQMISLVAAVFLIGVFMATGLYSIK